MIHHLRGTSLAFAENVFIGAERARKLRARRVGVNCLFRGWRTGRAGGAARGLAPELLIITIMRTSLCSAALLLVLALPVVASQDEKAGGSDSARAVIREM